MKVVSRPVSDGLHFLGWLIDLSFDQVNMALREKGTARALEWASVIDKMDLTDTQRLELDYFQANAWANRDGKAQNKNKPPGLGATNRSNTRFCFFAAPSIILRSTTRKL